MVSQSEWDRAKGEECPRCGKDTLRLLHGICGACYKRAVAESERALDILTNLENNRAHLRFGKGALSKLRRVARGLTWSGKR